MKIMKKSRHWTELRNAKQNVIQIFTPITQSQSLKKMLDKKNTGHKRAHVNHKDKDTFIHWRHKKLINSLLWIHFIALTSRVFPSNFLITSVDSLLPFVDWGEILSVSPPIIILSRGILLEVDRVGEDLTSVSNIYNN